MTSRLLGAWILVSLVYGFQLFADGAMALARAGSSTHLLPMKPVVFYIIVGVLLVGEIIFFITDLKGGYES